MSPDSGTGISTRNFCKEPVATHVVKNIHDSSYVGLIRDSGESNIPDRRIEVMSVRSRNRDLVTKWDPASTSKLTKATQSSQIWKAATTHLYSYAEGGMSPVWNRSSANPSELPSGSLSIIRHALRNLSYCRDVLNLEDTLPIKMMTRLSRVLGGHTFVILHTRSSKQGLMIQR